ncbi:unnamed protein product [Schistosoma mattheei]|uniref:Uncharacterized protein n=1 Tax=Schistosoma mattheei TaxID=31246 RepID=A0A183PP75_9TREM|nr:unnamed protein product [Schistosoma mattheei]
MKLRIFSESKVSNQSTSHFVVTDMVCLNDPHISDEMTYKSEEYMLNESNHDQKHNAVLIDADFTMTHCSPLTLKFKENTSEKSDSDVLSNVICPQFIWLLWESCSMRSMRL